MPWPDTRVATRSRERCVSWALGVRTIAELRAVRCTRQERVGPSLRADDAQLVLATSHGTKGLEFDHVACIGFDEGVFPSRRTLEEADDPQRALEEERRLAYVAWTRAKQSLTIVYDPAAPSSSCATRSQTRSWVSRPPTSARPLRQEVSPVFVLGRAQLAAIGEQRQPPTQTGSLFRR